VEPEIVDAGQVDDLDAAGAEIAAAGSRRRGGAGEVRRLGAYAAQPVEDRGLACIRVAEQDDGCRHRPGPPDRLWNDQVRLGDHTTCLGWAPPGSDPRRASTSRSAWIAPG